MSEYNEIMKNAKGHGKKYAAFDPNKQKKTIIKLVIGLCIALAALLVIFKSDEIKNLMKTSSTSPTKHYLEIEKDFVDTKLGEYANFVNSYNDKVHTQARNRQISAKLEANPGLIAAFKAKGIDTHGATSAEFAIDSSASDDGNSYFFSSKLNNTELFDVSYFQGKKGNNDFVKVTQISDQFIEIEKEQQGAVGSMLGLASGSSFTVTNDSLFDLSFLLSGEEIPDRKETISKLLNIYLDFVKEKKLASRERTTKEVNGMSNSYNVFTVDMNGGEVCELVIKFLEAAKSDEKIESFMLSKVKDLEDLVGMDEAKIASVGETEETIDTYIKNFKDEKSSAENYRRTAVIKLYADINNNTLGHSIELCRETKQQFYLESIKAEKNSRFAYNLSYKVKGEEKAVIKAHGAANLASTSGTGVFTLGKGDKKIVLKASIDGSNIANLKSGHFIGKVTFTSNDLYPNGKMVADVDWNLNEFKFNSIFYENGQTTGNFLFSSIPIEAPTNTKPGNTDKVIKMNDTKAMAKYMEDFKIDKFVNRFCKKAEIDMTYEDLTNMIKKLGK